MTRSQSDIEDLKNLQREAAELRAKRKRARGSTGSVKAEKPAPEEEPEEDQILDSEDEDDLDESEGEASGMSVHLDTVVAELEILAQKHPSLALVSAFTIGFFAGKLFTRR